MNLGKKILFWAGLVIYTVIVFLLMTFYRLPADKLVAATIKNFSKGRLQFKAEKMSPALPVGYNIEELSYGISLGDTLAVDRLKSLTVKPDYQRLFKGYLPVRFSGVMQRGSIHGTTGVAIRGGVEDGYISIKIFDVFLEDLNILRSFSNRNLKGKLKGEINVKGNLIDPLKMEGEGHFYVEKGSIDSRIDLPGLKTLSFESIKFVFSIKDGLIVLKNSEMDGPILSGSFSGEIKLKKKITASQLKIKAMMKPGPLLANNQFASLFLSKIRKGNNPININVLGTVEKPSIVRSKL